MDHVTVILLVRGVITLAFIAGGMYALHIGYRLYMSGVGLKPDGTTADIRSATVKVRTGLKTVGSVLMATSIAWAFVAYLSRPDLHAHDDDSAAGRRPVGATARAPVSASAGVPVASPRSASADGGTAGSEEMDHVTDISVTMGSRGSDSIRNPGAVVSEASDNNDHTMVWIYSPAVDREKRVHIQTGPPNKVRDATSMPRDAASRPR